MAVALSEILENGDLPDNLLLGRLVVFTITDEPTPRKVLEQRFQQHNLNLSMLPPDIKPVDAFKKATSEAKDKYDLPDGTTAYYLCRDVTSTTEYVHRQITREIKDSRAKRLAYDKAIDCIFYRARPTTMPDGRVVAVKGGERVQFTVDSSLTEEEKRQVRVVAQGISDRYQKYYANLDGNRLRAVVRDYLKYMNAIEIKGGVYFIHVSKSNELANLQSLVNSLGGGCSMNTIPLVDIKREREMVTAAFEREAAQSLRDLTKEIEAIRASRKTVTTAAYVRLQERYNEVVAKANEHMTTLEVSQDITGAAAEMALDAMSELREAMLG